MWKSTLFNHVGTLFTDRIPINGTELITLRLNRGHPPVNISGNARKIGNMRKTVYPCSGLGGSNDSAWFDTLIWDNTQAFIEDF